MLLLLRVHLAQQLLLPHALQVLLLLLLVQLLQLLQLPLLLLQEQRVLLLCRQRRRLPAPLRRRKSVKRPICVRPDLWAGGGSGPRGAEGVSLMAWSARVAAGQAVAHLVPDVRGLVKRMVLLLLLLLLLLLWVVHAAPHQC